MNHFMIARARRWIAGAGLAMLLCQAMPAQAQSWPHSFSIPAEIDPAYTPRGDQAPILAWIPEKAASLRALLLMVANSDSMAFAASPPLRQVAARQRMGIVYFRYPAHAALEQGRNREQLPALLRHVGRELGIANFEHCPWVVFGKSSVGSFPHRVANAFPERTVATISYHAETLPWPAPGWAKPTDETILSLNVNGETEWGGTWSVHVRPSLLNYRAATSWLSHQAVAWRIDHGDYAEERGTAAVSGRASRMEVWKYISLFIDKALEMRLPAPDATDAPPSLRKVDADRGYLIHPYAVETLLGLEPMPLRRVDGVYMTSELGANGTGKPLTVAAMAADRLPAGVVPEAFRLGNLPLMWMTSGRLNFELSCDPMLSVGGLADLCPVEGDRIRIDGREARFKRLPEHNVGLDHFKLGGLHKTGVSTLLFYSVVKIGEITTAQVDAPFTPNGRVQMTINGQTVSHRQVVHLQPGIHVLGVVAQLKAGWDRLTAVLRAPDKDLTDADHDAPRGMPAEFNDLPLIAPAAEVPAAMRRRMFWVADEQQARAWFALHAVHGQQFETRPAGGSFDLAIHRPRSKPVVERWSGGHD